MKVALVLTGHMRCWEKAVNNTKRRIIDRYKPDVFISTWSTEGYWVSPDHDPYNVGVNTHSPLLDAKAMESEYKPMVSCVEDAIDFREPAAKYLPFCNEIRPHNIMSQFYKMYHGLSLMANHAVEHDIRYDLVIRMRPDLVFDVDLPELNPKKFYTLHHRNHTGQGTGDMFQATNMDDMLIARHFPHFYQLMVKECGNRFCPHMFIENVAKNFDWEELNLPKAILHSPNGTYQNYVPENKND